MALFSLFQRENRLPQAFLEHLRPGLSWTLVATGGSGKAPVITFMPQSHGAAASWIAKAQRQKRDVSVVMGEVLGPVSGVTLVRGHLRGSRHFGCKLPLAKAATLEAFQPEPFLRLETARTLYVAWRLFNEVELDVIERLAKSVADRLGGVNLGHLLPVAGTTTHNDGERLKLVHMFKDRLPMVTDFLGVEKPNTGAKFVRAASVKAKPLAWLWRGAVLRGALSLLAGPGGVGKSTVAASIAAIVTTGGVFPDGEKAEQGSVIFCEGEDDPESVTLPRLQAAGADLSRVIIGPVCDLSQSVEELEAAIRDLSEPPALLVLSPVRSFFGKESYIDTEIRARLAPVLRWAERNTVAILGVTHPPRGKQDIAGAGAWRNAARAGFFVDKDKRRPTRRILSPLKSNSGRDDWQLAYVIEGVKLHGGVETSRIVWQGENRNEMRRGDLHPVEEPAKPQKPKLRIVRQPKTDLTNVVRMPARDTDAVTWLRSALANGPRDAAELKREALRAGISKGSIYRAVKQLGAVIESKPNATVRDAKTWRIEP